MEDINKYELSRWLVGLTGAMELEQKEHEEGSLYWLYNEGAINMLKVVTEEVRKGKFDK